MKQTRWHYSPEAAEWIPRLGLREELPAASAPFVPFGTGFSQQPCELRTVSVGLPAPCQGAERLGPARSSCRGHGCRTEHTAEAAQGLGSHRSTTCSCHPQPLSSGSPSSAIRAVSTGKQDVVCGISSLQIRLVAPCALLMPVSSTRRTCVPLA